MSETTIRRVVEQLRTLPENLQQEVLYYTQQISLSAPLVGTPGKSLLKFAGAIPQDDVDLMRQAIETNCEETTSFAWLC